MTAKITAISANVGLWDASTFSVGTRSFGVTPATTAPVDTFAVGYHWTASAEL